jgi:hypothetical protein
MAEVLLEAVQRDDDPVGVATITWFESWAGRADRGLFAEPNARPREAGERRVHTFLSIGGV